MKRTDWVKNKFNPNGETREYYKTETGHKQALPIYWRNKIYSEEVDEGSGNLINKIGSVDNLTKRLME